MRALLDTHTLLWFFEDSPRLSARVTQLLAAASTDAVISIASLWEIAIKMSVGKLTINYAFDDLIATQLPQNDIVLLSVSAQHVAGVVDLPLHHRDPFDRMLVAQSVAEYLPIISADPIFDVYRVQRIW
ncbi:MAG TPA: type II toxin-antitoxin system VapC family toxin [Thermomicrobiales bacterium]|nr:type II toxin-antitoxin system VapC family toxin [Thermomicrobiales bacterium]